MNLKSPMATTDTSELGQKSRLFIDPRHMSRPVADDGSTHCHWALAVSRRLCIHPLRPRVSRRSVDSYASKL